MAEREAAAHSETRTGTPWDARALSFATRGDLGMDYDEATVIEDSLEINNQLVYESNFGICLDWMTNKFREVSWCPYCSGKLKYIHLQLENRDFKWDEDEGKQFKLWICYNCTYWQCLYEDPLAKNSYGCPDHFAHAGISKVREYDGTLPTGCHEELAKTLRRHPEAWHYVHPKTLEQLVSVVFKANYRNCEVIHVGKPDDGGVDVLFVDSDDRQWLIQVKGRKDANSSEGIATLRNLLGAMVLNDTAFGMVVSTADHFTYRAYDAIGKADTLGRTLKLIDRGKLNRMLGPILPQKPWANFVNNYYPELKRRIDRRLDIRSSRKNPREKGMQLRLFSE